MSLFRSLFEWVSGLTGTAHVRASEFAPKPKPPVTYPSITSASKPPRNEDVAPGVLYTAGNGNKPKWALFKCPCGCGDVVTLSMQRVHRPNWRLSRTAAARPTLYPSVWRDKGCMSHFWIDDGRVYWCKDSGSDPRFQSTET